MDNAQSALSPFFPRGDCVEFQFGSEQSGVPLARGGSVYASGYEKAAALAHIVSVQKQEGLRVFFFDDSVVNSYVVGTSTAQHLAESGLASAVAELRSYWWDSYEEEMGFSPTMELSSFEHRQQLLGLPAAHAPGLRRHLKRARSADRGVPRRRASSLDTASNAAEKKRAAPAPSARASRPRAKPAEPR